MGDENTPPCWTTEQIRESAGKWTLAGDVALLGHLQRFAQETLQKTAAVDESVTNLSESVESACTKFNNVSNQFLSLQNSQFLENRVYDDDSPTCDDLSNTQGNDEAESQQVTVARCKEAVVSGVKLLDSHFDRVELLESSDDEEDTQDSKLTVVWRPKPSYSKPLPSLIGSAEWWADDNVGLGEFQENNDSERMISASDSEETPPESKRVRLSTSSSSTSFEDPTPAKRPNVPTIITTVASDSADLFGNLTGHLFEEPAGVFASTGDLFQPSKSQNHDSLQKIVVDPLIPAVDDMEKSNASEEHAEALPKKGMERFPNDFKNELASKLGSLANKERSMDSPDNVAIAKAEPTKSIIEPPNFLPKKKISGLFDDEVEENDDLFSESTKKGASVAKAFVSPVPVKDVPVEKKKEAINFPKKIPKLFDDDDGSDTEEDILFGSTKANVNKETVKDNSDLFSKTSPKKSVKSSSPSQVQITNNKVPSKPAGSGLFGDDDEDEDDLFGGGSTSLFSKTNKGGKLFEAPLKNSLAEGKGLFDDESSSSSNSGSSSINGVNNHRKGIVGGTSNEGSDSRTSPKANTASASKSGQKQSVEDTGSFGKAQVPGKSGSVIVNANAKPIVHKGLFDDEDDDYDLFAPKPKKQQTDKTGDSNLFGDDNNADDLFASKSTDRLSASVTGPHPTIRSEKKDETIGTVSKVGTLSNSPALMQQSPSVNNQSLGRFGLLMMMSTPGLSSPPPPSFCASDVMSEEDSRNRGFIEGRNSLSSSDLGPEVSTSPFLREAAVAVIASSSGYTTEVTPSMDGRRDNNTQLSSSNVVGAAVEKTSSLFDDVDDDCDLFSRMATTSESAVASSLNSNASSKPTPRTSAAFNSLFGDSLIEGEDKDGLFPADVIGTASKDGNTTMNLPAQEITNESVIRIVSNVKTDDNVSLNKPGNDKSSIKNSAIASVNLFSNSLSDDEDDLFGGHSVIKPQINKEKKKHAGDGDIEQTNVTEKNETKEEIKKHKIDNLKSNQIGNLAEDSISYKENLFEGPKKRETNKKLQSSLFDDDDDDIDDLFSNTSKVIQVKNKESNVKKEVDDNNVFVKDSGKMSSEINNPVKDVGVSNSILVNEVNIFQSSSTEELLEREKGKEKLEDKMADRLLKEDVTHSVASSRENSKIFKEPDLFRKEIDHNTIGKEATSIKIETSLDSDRESQKKTLKLKESFSGTDDIFSEPQSLPNLLTIEQNKIDQQASEGVDDEVKVKDSLIPEKTSSNDYLRNSIKEKETNVSGKEVAAVDVDVDLFKDSLSKKTGDVNDLRSISVNDKTANKTLPTVPKPSSPTLTAGKAIPPSTLNIKNTIADLSRGDNEKREHEPPAVIKKVGKLNIPTGLKINPAALMPGAKPLKALVNEREDESLVKDENEEAKLGAGISMSPQDEPLSGALHHVNRDRARIVVKRRPPTRKARHEALRKSGIDFGEEEPPSQSSTPGSNPLSPSTDEEDCFTVPDEKEDSLFSNALTEKSLLFEKAPVLSPLEASIVAKPTPSSKKEIVNIGDDLFESSSLFSNIPPQTVDINNDDDDLFASQKERSPSPNPLFQKMTPRPKKPVVSNLFGDISDDDDSEIFCGTGTSIPTCAVSSKSTSSPSKTDEAPTEKKHFIDPLGLLLESDET